jgi:hypothetical protein
MEQARTPALQIDTDRVMAAAFGRPDVAQVRFRRNVFGSASLSVRYYEPVAAVEGSFRGRLNAEGAFYLGSPSDPRVPMVRLPAATRRTQATLLGVASPLVLAQISRAAQDIWPDARVRIEIDPGGSYNIEREGMIIRLGTSDALEAKLAELSRLVHADPQLPMKYRRLNLMVPTQPQGETR